MKYIPLTQNKQAMVDDEDYEWLNQWKWYISNKGYAIRGVRNVSLPTGYKSISMHRLINNTPDGYETDHKNGDKLDNRRVNIRTASRAQNRYNTPPRADNKSGVAGVIWYKPLKKWLAYIQVDKKHIHLGYYYELNDAVAVRRTAESTYCGDFSWPTAA